MYIAVIWHIRGDGMPIVHPFHRIEEAAAWAKRVMEEDELDTTKWNWDFVGPFLVTDSVFSLENQDIEDLILLRKPKDFR
jgi:hypothetical protein